MASIPTIEGRAVVEATDVALPRVQCATEPEVGDLSDDTHTRSCFILLQEDVTWGQIAYKDRRQSTEANGNSAWAN